MGKFTGGSELAPNVLSGSLSATGNSASMAVLGEFNLTVTGTFTATAQLQKSYDGGTTFVPVTSRTTGSVIQFTAPGTVQFNEFEPGVLYIVACTAFTSGTINYRISGGARLT